MALPIHSFSVQKYIYRPVVRISRHIALHPVKYTLLTSLFILGGALYSGYNYLLEQEKRSTQIGKAVGKYFTQQQAKRTAADKITQEASANRHFYQQACREMAYTVNTLCQTHSDKTPPEIIDMACTLFEQKKEIDSAQKNIIIEDMQTIKTFFKGSLKDLHNMMCFYHLSPEVKFNNRYSEPFEVNFAVQAYQTKAKRWINEENIFIRQKMLRETRNR